MSSDPLDRQLGKHHYHGLVREAAFLSREFLGRIESNKFSGDFIYVLDTDIYRTRAAINEKGPLDFDGSNGLGQLLPRRYQISQPQYLSPDERAAVGEKRKSEDRLAVRALRLIIQELSTRVSFDNLDEKMPCLSFPSHVEEYSRVKRALEVQKEAFTNSGGLSESDVFPSTLKRQLEALTTRKQQIDLENDTARLMNFFISQEVQSSLGPIMTFDKFNEPDVEGFGWPEFEKLTFGGKKSHRGYLEPEETQGRAFLEWYFTKRLEHKTKYHSKSHKNVRNDAEALALLAMLNRRLLINNIDTRIVFVTADRNLVAATYTGEEGLSSTFDEECGKFYAGKGIIEYSKRSAQLRSFFDVEVPDINSPFAGWFERFGLNYVRHISSYAHETIAESEERKDRLSNIFSGMFASQAEAVIDSRPHLEQLALGERKLPVPESYEAIYANATNRWDALVDEASSKHRMDELLDPQGSAIEHIMRAVTEDTRRLMKDKTLKGEDLYDAAKAWMVEYLERTRDQTMLKFSNIGTNGLTKTYGHGRRLWIVRNPPDLTFHNLTHTARIFTTLSAKVGGYSGGPEQRFNQDYDNIAKDIPSQYDDPRLESHLKFLALAAAFAAAEKWSVAQGHASKAVGIIERAEELNAPIPPVLKGGKKANISGREAYFLSAVCARYLARKTDDLELAEDYLRRSDKAHEADKIADEDRDVARIKFRSEVEWLSVELARYYLVRHDCHETSKREVTFKRCDFDHAEFDTRPPPCRECKKAYDNLLERAKAILSKPEMDYFLNDGDEPTLTDMSMALAVIQLSLIRSHWETDGKIDWQSDALLHRSVEAFEEIGKRFVISDVARTYVYVGQLLLSQRGLGDPPEELSILSYRSHFRPSGSWSVTYFDNWRLKRLLEFVEKHHQKHTMPEPQE